MPSDISAAPVGYASGLETAPPPGALGPTGSSVMSGELEWAGEPKPCCLELTKTGIPCRANPVKETSLCAGHTRSIQKNQLKG
jgi:hypothetical protein